MNWDLPTTVTIDGVTHKIRNKCDYRVVLDCIEAINDIDLEPQNRAYCALYIFYEDFENITDYEKAIEEMYKIINYGEEDDGTQHKKLMDWKHDFKPISSGVSKALGYDVRNPEKFTHWWSFLSGYMEIGESVFSTIVSIRQKKQKGKRLEKWEEEFYRENRKMVDLPIAMTQEEREFLQMLGGV
jgi:hypothetical protein